MNHNNEPTVFVVDDDEDMRNSLQRLLDVAGMRVEVYDSAVAFLESYSPRRPGCLVLDVRMPGMSGLELQEKLQSRGARIPVIIITGHADVPKAVRALRSGAMDFIEKPFNARELLRRIEEAVKADERTRDHRAQLRELRERVGRLTPREKQVMERVAAGDLNKQIAADLNLSHKTVELHRAKVMSKMQVESLAELVRSIITLEHLERDFQVRRRN